MRCIAVLSACVLVGGLVAPTAALASDGGHGGADRWIAVEDRFAVVLPDGTTFTGEEPTEPAMPVGTRLFIGEALHATDDGTTRGDAVGRTAIECTALVVPDQLSCDIVFVFDADGQLHGSVFVDFTTLSPTEPLHFDIAVTGGTGRYAGADGVVSLLDTSDTTDPAAETTTLYEADLD